MTHVNPNLLQRVVRTLCTENCEFFIHVDMKVDLSKFQHVRGTNVRFLSQRVNVYWGGYSTVEAILALIRSALRCGQSWDYLVLLSGSDYPIRSARYIESYLSENAGAEFMSLTRIPNDAAGKPLKRINTI